LDLDERKPKDMIIYTKGMISLVSVQSQLHVM